MRKVVLSAAVSIDGYIARPDGAVDFLFIPKDYSFGPFFSTVDIAVIGRKTFDAAIQMSGSFRSGMTTYVFSRSQPAGEHDGVIFTDEPVKSLITGLRNQPGKNIWLMGGGELAREFLQSDLIDELHLAVIPILLGAGIPLFPAGFPQRDFALLESKTYSQGLVVVKYERVRSTPIT